jgi:hypothetical protein
MVENEYSHVYITYLFYFNYNDIKTSKYLLNLIAFIQLSHHHMTIKYTVTVS